MVKNQPAVVVTLAARALRILLAIAGSLCYNVRRERDQWLVGRFEMPEWQLKITWTRMLEGDLEPQATAAQGRLADKVVDAMISQVPGDGWEPVSHDISRLNVGLFWTIMWRLAK